MLFAGCTLNTTQQTLVASLQGKLRPAVDSAPLNPNYRYLRVELDGFDPALLVLGNLDPGNEGAVEVWFASTGEVLKTQQGRIVGTVGLPTDWSSVNYPTAPVAWSSGMAQESAYERVRSVLPSYRFGVTESVVVTSVPQSGVAQLPPVLFGGGLRKTDAAKYRWYKEQAAGVVGPDLPAAWFALGRRDGREMVVFSRQCLAIDLCMNLQLWPVQGEALKP